MSILDESRYDRQERIAWWDQSRLRSGKVLVVGAGALGNELVKNLVLLGVGHIDVVDMDLIEHTNLARCVFFREGDEGKPKATALATAAQGLNPDVSVTAYAVKVQQLGTGFISRYDVVLGGLDNREARLWVNRACRRLGILWIDGAIEGLHGVVQAFGSVGACYECTLTSVDWKILSHRRSCALLGVQEMLEGKTPTNVTTASLIAGIQVQEAVKYLVGKSELLSLIGKQWTLLGENMIAFTSTIDEDEECLAHDGPIPVGSQFIKPKNLGEILRSFKEIDLYGLHLSDDFLTLLPCVWCGEGGAAGLRSLFTEGQGSCPKCSRPLRVRSQTAFAPNDPALEIPFDSLVWSKCEFVSITGESQIYGALVWRSDEQE